ncbi:MULTISPECIES: hypothetical protein [unclassified Streptomyces]|uniref:hypothetical protein n=1 Tax=unclassified Streptomyces TaxID=2593676 RepID=UPI000747C827|nr:MULTISPECIES: hypothetical protein [unclassified Streptomyces]KUL51654.1 hypothetical protein ADL30_26480 [Streptomyces sp. NRRL S-1521]
MFRTKGLANHYRSDLLRAAHGGEEFHTVTGLPGSMVEKAASMSWFAFALRYLATKRLHVAPNTRNGINESLTAVTMSLLDDRPGRPPTELTRRALRNSAFAPLGSDDRELPDAIAHALYWMSKAETVRRKRRTFVNALHYAVDLLLSVAPAASLLAPLADCYPEGSVRFALYAEADGLATLTVWGF